MSQKRVLFNLIYPTRSIGGGWNYVYNFISSIFSNEKYKQYEFFSLCNDESVELVEEYLPKKNIKICISKNDSKTYIRRIYYENIIANKFITENNIKIQHWFGNVASPLSSIKNLITVHDLLFWNSLNNIPRRVYQKNLIKINGRKKNNYYLPISIKTKNDLEEKIKGLKIGPVIPNALPNNYGESSIENINSFLCKYKLTKPYILYVSHTYKHKNHITLLDAFNILKSKYNNLKLVFRGDPKANHKKVIEKISVLDLNDKIVWIPRISSQEMQLLYKGAKAMVFPSTYEGGGIPLMEAFACSCPVACSSIDVFKEYYGDLPIYFDEKSAESIASAIVSLIENNELRNSMKLKSKKYMHKYRYEVISEDIFSMYK